MYMGQPANWLARFLGKWRISMPQFMKSSAITLLAGGIESYKLGLYGLTLPIVNQSKQKEARFAPIIGLLGASVELIIKACLVQAKGTQAMYKDGNIEAGVYKFGTEVLKEFKAEISKNSGSVSFMWKNKDDNDEQRKQLLSFVNKFSILQSMRANGLHAGKGCSRDIAICTANDIYQFIQLLSQGKRLKAYLKNIPAPEATVRDREAIIEDLSRRISASSVDEEKIGYLRNMYLVLPYIPDEEPEWVQILDKLTVVPPSKNDLSYLVESLEQAHSIYLLKNRGGKDGIPVKIDPNDPDALPIEIQNIKRKLNGIPAEFNNDVVSANTRIDRDQLDLPIDDFLIDLFALGVDKANILQGQEYFTAQQVWPFVVSAFSTQGTPRPCMELIQRCNEYNQLLTYLKRANEIGNGYYKRRYESVKKCVEAIRDGVKVDLHTEKDKAFVDIYSYLSVDSSSAKPFTIAFLRKYPISDEVAPIIGGYMSSEISAGGAIEQLLKFNNLKPNDKKCIHTLMQLCTDYETRNGLVAILRSEQAKAWHSEARKRMFTLDILQYVDV